LYAGTINESAIDVAIALPLPGRAPSATAGVDAIPTAGEIRAVAIVVRPLRADDLDEADRVFRLAFGTFLGLPDPLRFAGDTDYVRSRWRIAPDAAFAAERDGTLVGSVFAEWWRSVGFFGPLSVRPDCWDGGVAQRLLPPVMDYFNAAGVTHAGLFTFAQSAKHVGLYGKFGFYPRFLTIVGAKPVPRAPAAGHWTRASALSEPERAQAWLECRAVTDTLHEGLDLANECRATIAYGLGDVVLLRARDGGLVGFAVCHVGAGTEAGSDTCYVKFGAVACGDDAARHFEALLDACEAFAAGAGVGTLVAGVNLARDHAHAALKVRGFRTIIQGVAMHRPNVAGYSRSDVYALDDWR
jgi:predicted N-acetyltransferase YhbS